MRSSRSSLALLGSTPQESLKRLRAEKARRSLADFFRYGWHVIEPTTPLDWNWHIDAICQHAQATIEDWMRRQRDPTFRQRIQNLLVNVPPGCSKSRIVSVYLPAWVWLHWPSWRSIFLSSNPRVATRDSVYCRDLIQSKWYQEWFEPDWNLAEDQNLKTLYHNTAGGFRQGQGFTANIAGDRADALIVDDPHDPDKVYSEADRREVETRWKSTVSNRVNDLRTSVRMGIMQRVHAEDWSAVVLKEGNWHHLMIAQEYEPDRAVTTAIGWHDPRTEPGERLDPVRFPEDVLDFERKRLGSFGYAGQHQQRPAPAEGGTFKRAWLRYYTTDRIACPKCKGQRQVREVPCKYCRAVGMVVRYHLLRKDVPPKIVLDADCRRFGTMDLAFSLKKTADFTVIQSWAVTPDSEMILLESFADRIDGPELVPEATKRVEKFQLAYIGIEDVQAQTLVVKEARRKGLTVKSLDPDGDKLTRAIPAAIRMEAEQVFLPESAPWLARFETVLLQFPGPGHDDEVDCLAYAALEVAKRGGSGVETEEARREREAKEAADRKVQEENWYRITNDRLFRSF